MNKFRLSNNDIYNQIQTGLENYEKLSDEKKIDLCNLAKEKILKFNSEHVSNIVQLCERIKNSSDKHYDHSCAEILQIARGRLNLLDSTFQTAERMFPCLGKHGAPVNREISPAVKLKIDELTDEEELLLFNVFQILESVPGEGAKQLKDILEYALIERDSYWRELKNSEGYTILHFLSAFKEDHVILDIVSLAKNINVQTTLGKETPLHCACKNSKVIEYLCQNSPDLDLKNAKGLTVFELAIFLKEYETVGTFLKFMPSVVNKIGIYFPLSIAIKNQDPKMIALLLENGADLNYVSQFDENCIYLAALTNNQDALQVFIDRKISLDDAYGKSDPALILACKKNNFNAFKFLIERGANPDVFDQERLTPLMIAIKEKKIEQINFLLTHGANINCIAKLGMTPLLQSLYYGNAKLASRLIKAGANIDHIDESGMTALEYILINEKLANEKDALQTELLLRKCDVRGVNTIRSRKILAHIWAIGNGATFILNNTHIKYEGFNTSKFFIQIIQEAFEKYLPILRKEFADCFTLELEKKLRLSFDNASQNQYRISINPDIVLERCKEIPQLLVSGWKTNTLAHATSAIIYKNRWLAKCNRGMGYNGHSILFYRYAKAFDPVIIHKILLADDPDYFQAKLDEELELQKAGSIVQKPQKVGNCSWASLKTAIFAIFTLLGTDQASGETIYKDRKIQKIYKSFSSFILEQELKKYLGRCANGEEEVDWLLMSKIRLKLYYKQKIGKYVDLEKANYEKALTHFDTYLSPELCVVTEENKKAIIHYCIAKDDSKGVEEAISLGVDLNESFGGMTPKDTMAIKNDPLILNNFYI